MMNKIKQYVVEHNLTGFKKWYFILIGVIAYSIGVICGYLKAVVEEINS